MSNKPFEKLYPADQRLRRMFPSGMRDGVDVTIEFVCGFELQNTRPYHNYETWSHEYRVRAGDILVVREDLDEALDDLERELFKKREKKELKK